MPSKKKNTFSTGGSDPRGPCWITRSGGTPRAECHAQKKKKSDPCLLRQHQPGPERPKPCGPALSSKLGATSVGNFRGKFWGEPKNNDPSVLFRFFLANCTIGCIHPGLSGVNHQNGWFERTIGSYQQLQHQNLMVGGHSSLWLGGHVLVLCVASVLFCCFPVD